MALFVPASMPKMAKVNHGKLGLLSFLCKLINAVVLLLPLQRESPPALAPAFLARITDCLVNIWILMLQIRQNLPWIGRFFASTP